MVDPGNCTPYGIYSVDDHEIVHAGIERMSSRETDFAFLGASSSIPEVTEIAARDPDIVLLDLFVGDENSWALCRDLCEQHPRIKVVFYTGYGNAQLVDKAVRLGAAGFILKSATMAALPDMLRTAIKVGQFIDATLLSEWARARRNTQQGAQLSEQEILVVSMIADGLDNYAIAERMNLSFHTVKFHIGKMLKLTGEQNRAGLVRFAKERFLID